MSNAPTDSGALGSVRSWAANIGRIPRLVFGTLLVAAVFGAVINITMPGTRPATVAGLFNVNFVESTLRISVPLVFAGIGGIFAEKSGVINIGLEGLLIISAFTAAAVTHLLGGDAQSAAWIGLFAGVLASTLLALVFAVLVIEFKADQIIAGLAVWLVGLGLGPFLSIVIWGSVNSASIATLNTVTVPGLSQIPVVGPIIFDASPIVILMLVTIVLSWFVLNRTSFGRWIEASGENPSALDTAGIDVHRVRYVGVVLSGVLSGFGGAGLVVGRAGRFIGSGQTMIAGDGFIAITTYLFGNYNPLGTAAAGILFAGLDALQIRLQQIAFVPVPTQLIQLVPYVAVIIVLAFVGYTRIPSEVGEHYESGEE
ncbi:ABC transporter permease [Halorhabdus sp. CUG00001]|uniref:ABC transporter permease n=1 Tax=Halorhabdus sp. CUG00001 TaxID=2600297 RepID=UPI00131AE2A1